MNTEQHAFNLAAEVARDGLEPYVQSYLFANGRFIVTVRREDPLDIQVTEIDFLGAPV